MSKISAEIFDIQRASFVDGPGVRTTVFFYGCNLRCKWCHNPEGLGLKNIVVPDKYKPKEYTSEELISIISEDKAFYDKDGGVTLSGGECMLQYEFLEEFLPLCKNIGIHTAIDTAGNVPFECFEKTAKHTDLYLYDIKCITSGLHKEFTGVDNELILQNYKRLISMNKNVIVRIPFIPGFNTKDDEINKIRDFLTQYTPKQIELLPYHTLGIGKYQKLGLDYTNFEEPTSQTVKKYQNIFNGIIKSRS